MVKLDTLWYLSNRCLCRRSWAQTISGNFRQCYWQKVFTMTRIRITKAAEFFKSVIPCMDPNMDKATAFHWTVHYMVFLRNALLDQDPPIIPKLHQVWTGLNCQPFSLEAYFVRKSFCFVFPVYWMKAISLTNTTLFYLADLCRRMGWRFQLQ